MRLRVTVIIVQDEKALLIHRLRKGRFFYVIPGGGVEEGETWTQAALREAKEETNLDVVLGPRLWLRVWTGNKLQQIEQAFLVTQFSGEPALLDPEILAAQSEDNIYRLEWVPLATFDQYDLYPGPVDVATIETAVRGLL